MLSSKFEPDLPPLLPFQPGPASNGEFVPHTRWLIPVAALIAFVTLAVSFGGTNRASAGGCEDPTPAGGGPMRFSGIGQLAHVVTRAGQVCPGQSETWSFFSIDAPIDQYVTIQVLADSGVVDARVLRDDGSEVVLTTGTPYLTTVQYATFRIVVLGKGSDLATYRVQACRSINRGCVLPDSVTPKPGDVNCDGRIDAMDALLILQSTANLATMPCGNVAETFLDGFVNAIDAQVLLQYHAGLIPELLPGF